MDDSRDRPDDFASPEIEPAAETTERTDESRGYQDRPSANGGGQDDDYSTGQRRRRRRRRRSRGGVGEMQGQGQGQRRDRGGHGRDRDRATQGRGRSDRSRRVRSVIQAQSANGQEVTGTIEGVLEMHPKGYGFLRDPKRNYHAQDTDPFVSSSVIEKYRLREGVMIRGDVGPGTKGQGPRLMTVEVVDGRSLDEYAKIRNFEDLTPVNPFEHIKLETGPRPITMRVMDLLTPVGKGQRALIVAAPRTGKTMLLQDIADAVSTNHPELYLIVLLIDERPEEVTEMCRKVRGEVIAS
ncbi:MAG TPA: transcription termination factor Rho, partial [Planctomycetaceae bacterium]|nr:transcription termination factor Rho [Planctomycetaceae bacterium]